MGLLFWGSGTPTFWLGLLLFIKRESRTPTFKILVRTLIRLLSIYVIYNIVFPFRKHVYLNILRILPPKNENFQMKNSGSFHISAQNIDCGYLLEPSQRRGSNKYPQSMFMSRNKKINVYPCKPQFEPQFNFYCIKVRFKGVKTRYIDAFSWCKIGYPDKYFPYFSMKTYIVGTL